MSEVTLYLGDCLDVMKGMDAGSVDAVITDPPYGLGFEYTSFVDTRENVKRLVDNLIPLARKVAKRVFVLPGITQVNLYPEPDWIACITWNTTGSFGKYGFTQWMPIICYGTDIKGFGSVNGGTLKSDVIRISGGGGVGFMRSGEKDKHPCPKPVNLMRLIMERFTLPGETILDPLMGIATTGVACIQTGRNFIGIEIDPGYYAIAEKRIRQAQQQPTLWDAASGSTRGR